jgi:dienelactone hydrolase
MPGKQLIPLVLMMILTGLAAQAASPVPVEVRPFEYKLGDTTFDGYLVGTSQGPKQPGIVMVHDWMGASQKTVEKAERVASLGYQVLVADVYGKGVRPKSPEEAGKLAGRYKGDRKLFRAHLTAALDALKAQDSVDPKRLAVLGYCFGGTGAVELARSGADLKAVVSFHGGLDSPTPADGKNIKAEVLALHGADDPFVKPADLKAFESELRSNKVKLRLVKYPGAVHAFTDKEAGSDNSKGAAYNARADAASFQEMKKFLAKVL